MTNKQQPKNPPQPIRMHTEKDNTDDWWQQFNTMLSFMLGVLAILAQKENIISKECQTLFCNYKANEICIMHMFQNAFTPNT